MLYFLYDVRSIKNFIFDSMEFKVTAGGSLLVKKFDEAIECALREKVDFIYAAGGTGLGEVKANDPKEIIEIFEDVKSKHLFDHPVFYTFIDDSELNRVEFKTEKGELLESPNLSGFGETLAKIFFIANRKKTAWTGLKDVVVVDDERKLCKSCYHRRRVDKEFCEVCREKSERVKEYIKSSKNSKITFDIESIAKRREGFERKFMGVMYADGNSLGDIYLSFESEDDYRSFSDELLCMVDRAKNVIADEIGVDEFTTPILGGDDFMIIVQPNKLLDAVEKFCEFIDREKVKLKNGKKLTFSIGAVVLPVDVPIKFVFQIVEALQEKAKEKRYSDINDNKEAGEEHYVSVRFLHGTNLSPYVEEGEKLKFGSGLKLSEFKKLREWSEKLRGHGTKFATLREVIRLSDNDDEARLALLYLLGRALDDSRNGFKIATEFVKEVYDKGFFGDFLDIYNIEEAPWEM